MMRFGLVVHRWRSLDVCGRVLFWLVMARMLLGFGAGAVRPAMRRLAFVIEPGRAGEMLGSWLLGIWLVSLSDPLWPPSCWKSVDLGCRLSC